MNCKHCDVLLDPHPGNFQAHPFWCFEHPTPYIYGTNLMPVARKDGKPLDKPLLRGPFLVEEAAHLRASGAQNGSPKRSASDRRKTSAGRED